MLKRGSVVSRTLLEFDGVAAPALLAALRAAAKPLRGARLLHINSSTRGGGVAEILRSEVGLLNDLGIQSEWRVMEGSPAFFDVTKRIHNGLQGGRLGLAREEWALYEEYNRRLADELDGRDWDFIVLHDPQPAATLAFCSRRGQARWLWRCHIDSTHPNPAYRDRFRRYTAGFDGHVFSMPQYVLQGAAPRPFIVPPAIDPLSEKNVLLTAKEARTTVARFGLDPSRPLVTQVSRFDPWKDPVGVVEAVQLARRRVPGLQLALIGATADDDPESQTILEEVLGATDGDLDCHVLANRCGDRDVKAFQMASDVVLQKSLREGFGLTVSEALWAGTPVIGGRAGGIPLQIVHGEHGLLVDTHAECADAIAQLLRDPQGRREMGRAGREHVRRHFLLPRLVRDELRVLQTIRAAAPPAQGAVPRGGGRPKETSRAADGAADTGKTPSRLWPPR